MFISWSHQFETYIMSLVFDGMMVTIWWHVRDLAKTRPAFLLDR